MIPGLPRNPRRAHWPWRHTLTHAITSSRQQRGTVLLMVVGVLALLAIIGVVYATVGRADRNGAITRQREQRITDQSEEIAAYIAKVIGDATSAQYVERTEDVDPLTGLAWKSRTRGYTYPWTDEHFLSINPTNYTIASGAQNLPALPAGENFQWFTKFSPTGDNPDPWQKNQGNASAVTTSDPRNHADPYLATIEPEWLRFTTQSPDGPFFNIRDWRHISNLSPSGNFVNLANLRKSNLGGFDAPPGFRVGSATNLAQMSYGLTLRDRTDPRGRMQPHTAPQKLPSGLNANPANPAHWANNQIFAYQPAIDGDHQSDEYEYVLNQWCDTDGDGFLDSRWFELTDLSQMFGVNASAPRQFITTRGRVRLFCAARVVDNSAKINVNTASDMLSEGSWPTADFVTTLPNWSDPTRAPLANQKRYLTRDSSRPPGSTPADIALNRVLRLSDINLTLTQLAGTGPALPLGYSGIPTPSNTAYDSTTTNYSTYTGIVGTLATPSNDVGKAAYAALLDARKLGTSAVRDPQLAQSSQFTYVTAGDRFDHYDLFAADPHSARSSTLYAASAGQRVLRSPFDLSDELELSTFWGVNDSSTLSRLEAAVGGRSSASGDQYRKFSPLRDNRSRALEMTGRDEIGAADLFTYQNRAPLLAAYTDIRHLLTTVNGSVPLKDGGVAPDPTRFNPASTDISAALKAIREYGEIPPGALPTDPLVIARTLARTQAIQLIFKLYANALAPYTDTEQFPSAWNGTNGTNEARRGLVYGGNAELALRIAAHMTANLVDAFDRDRPIDPATGRPYQLTNPTPAATVRPEERNEPTRIALKLAQVPDATIPNSGGATTAQLVNGVPQVNFNAGYPNSPANAAPLAQTPSRLPLDPGSLPSSGSYRQQVGMMTIFGVEPQPFLTEYGVLAMYTDAPDSSDVADSTDPNREITIDMHPVLSNGDFICEVIAFQVNNPFNQDIVLYDPNATKFEKFKFYIELAGRYYAFRPQDVDTVAFGANTIVKIGAGKTRTFYALNPGTLKAVGQRILDARDPTIPFTPPLTTVDQARDLAQVWIEHQLKRDTLGITDRPLQLTQVDPVKFDPILPTGGATALNPNMDLWGELPAPLNNATNLATTPHSIAERRVCNLWRTVRAQASVSSSTTSDIALSADNETSNDILADRMHDPSDPATPGNESGYLFNERTQAGSGDTVQGTVGDPVNQTGFTATVWAAVRRPTDVKTPAGEVRSTLAKGGTQDLNGRPYRGVLPPWCLEARMDSKYLPASQLSNGKYGLNRTFRGSPNDQGKDNNYPDADKGRFKTLRDAITSNNAVNPDIGIACPRKGNGDTARSNPIGKTKEADTNYQRLYSEVAVEFHDVGEDLFGGAEDTARNGGVPPGTSDRAIPRSRNPALFSRAGDFLLPLAVGPWFDPSRRGSDLTNPSVSSNARAWVTVGSTNSMVADREASWMTLSEALALSCGYYSPQDPRDPFFEFGIYSNIGMPPTFMSHHSPKADRGHLVLNAFTPYLKVTGGVEQPLGSGVPFALSIIDQFRAAFGVSSTPKQVLNAAAGVVAPEQQTRTVSYGGGSTSVAAEQTLGMLTRREGVPNINTQPLTTMRANPLLTPEDDAGSFLRTPKNYFSASNGVALYDVAGDNDYDIAPTIKAVRDLSLENYFERNGLAPRTVDFTLTTNPTPRKTKTQFSAPEYIDPYRREALGFKSLGDLAAVNVPWKAGASTIQDPILDHNSIFRFGERDQRITPAAPFFSILNLPTGTLGTTNRTAMRLAFQPEMLSSRTYNWDLNGVPDKVAPTVHNDTAAPHYALSGNELRNGYQEKLAIVNALTNTVAVRSDVFTVYFVIHGYTPDDCDIEPGQPLVPSVAKRYVMVVDRSSVVTGTDKPRILMLKEVPMQ